MANPVETIDDVKEAARKLTLARWEEFLEKNPEKAKKFYARKKAQEAKKAASLKLKTAPIKKA